MATAIAEGAKAVQGTEVELKYHSTPEELAGYDTILIGASTYHHDMSLDLKNLFEEAAVKKLNLKGKIGAAFGSYGWSGEAPRLVLEIMKNKFQMRIIEPCFLVKNEPDQKSLENCREYGKKIAEEITPRT